LPGQDVANEGIEECVRGFGVVFGERPEVLAAVASLRLLRQQEGDEGAAVLLRHPLEQGASRMLITGFMRATAENEHPFRSKMNTCSEGS
jgi:hypothetical protein